MNVFREDLSIEFDVVATSFLMSRRCQNVFTAGSISALDLT
jgi:hypothetical protein